MGCRRWWSYQIGAAAACAPRMGCLRHRIVVSEGEEEEWPSLDVARRRRVGRRKWGRMVRTVGCVLLSSGVPTSQNGRGRIRREGAGPDDNKSWLLGEGNGGEEEEKAGISAVDPQSVHSSFRFSFDYSPVEADPAAPGAHSPAAAADATVLLLNLEKEEEEGEEEEEASSSTSVVSSSSSSLVRDRRLITLKWTRLESLERCISPVPIKLVRYSYSEIRSATRDFSRGSVLGRGALSCVYRGRLRRGGLGGLRRRAVAVKRLEGPEKECTKAFCRELIIACSLQHPNIVSLLGFCICRDGLCLVYQYVSGGSLDSQLHAENNGMASDKDLGLPWNVRFKVALATARAVEYLHYGTDKCVIHRDIKPSNILLSSKKNPKLCDFGLATWTEGPSLPFLCKSVKGTFGYLAPEYFQHGKLSDKTDVYAFGVLLLELITGRKPIDMNMPQGDENLVLWAKPLLYQGETAMKDLVDPWLRSSYYNKSEICRMACAAAACLNGSESGRPTMTKVISILCGEEQISSALSVFTATGCFDSSGPQFHDHPKSDISRHVALAMLGVSDSDEDDMYGR